MRRIVAFGLPLMVFVVIVLPAVLGRLTSRTEALPPPQVNLSGTDGLEIQVYFPASQQVRKLPLGEYLVGVVAAEMPPDFADEALKAQFVVARTYAVHRMQGFRSPGKVGCPLKPEADICADPNTGQAYTSREAVVAKMGDKAAASYWDRLARLQAATEGQVLRYRGELVDPLYHAVSGTKTENADEYFQESEAYLRSVDDSAGAGAPSLKATETLTLQELSQKLTDPRRVVAVTALASSVKSGKSPVQVVDRTSTGRVKTVKVLGTVTMTGRELREKLGLRSTNFTVTVQGDKVSFHTTGYGHGVGMSQWGAEGMARSGKSYQAILLHYYQGVTITPLFKD